MAASVPEPLRIVFVFCSFFLHLVLTGGAVKWALSPRHGEKFEIEKLCYLEITVIVSGAGLPYKAGSNHNFSGYAFIT